jgi:hypothetical protein
MARVTFRDWVLDADADATRAAYARARTGGSEACGCDPCRNFVAARARVYPDEVRALFAQLGVDLAKESEAYWTHRSSDGLHHYGGWFHFVGAIVSCPASRVPVGGEGSETRFVEVTPGFSLRFEEASAPRLEALRDARAVQIWFDAAVPWQCDRPEPDVAAAEARRPS